MLTNPAPLAGRRALLSVGLAAALAAGTVGAATPASADTAVAPKSGSITIEGAGWGHGKGMSQYGAYGAASKGLDYAEILAFYYSGTTLESLPGGNTVRVLITGDTDNALHVRPVAGLRLTDSAGARLTLPTGSRYTKWRITRSGEKRVLAYRSNTGKYVTYKTKLTPTRVWYFDNPKTGTVRLEMPSLSIRTYRGKLSMRLSGSGTRTINTVAMEDYLRSVVPAEMPATWSAHAVRAQAVAARTYAARLRSTAGSGAQYDLCDTSACQVYGDTSKEHSASDAAIKATANEVLHYKGKLALTMFSSSNGGWSASAGSDYPYLKAKKDPYDGVKRDQTWSKTLTATTIQKAYPAIGTLKSVQVTERDGDGTYGGRVEKIKLSGSKGSVTLTGGTFKSKFGLKERLFKVVGGTVTTSPNVVEEPSANYTRWRELGGAEAAIGSPTGAEVAVAGGLRLKFEAADLWWSSATGSHLLTGAVRAAYNDLGGATSKLGFPRTDVASTDSGSYADFAVGRITCPSDADCVVAYG